MIKEGRLRVIDFQGARFGPLAYDLASLLIDPYTPLPEEEQASLLLLYLGKLERTHPAAAVDFVRQYHVLALQRNLQILGAFAFLSQRRGKTFFANYMAPAASSLHRLLVKPELACFPILRRTAEASLILLNERRES